MTRAFGASSAALHAVFPVFGLVVLAFTGGAVGYGGFQEKVITHAVSVCGSSLLTKAGATQQTSFHQNVLITV